MKISETLYVTNKEAWRTWLRKNHKTKKDIWLIYYKKASNKPRIPYNDAVDQALCFGWIDSIVKSIDQNKFAQRFTPRKKNSHLSTLNKERIKLLIKNRKMTKAGLETIKQKFDPNEKFSIAKDIQEIFKENKTAWTNFKAFPEPYQRIRIGYVEMQRKHSIETFKKALDHLIKKSEKNIRFGMVK